MNNKLDDLSTRKNKSDSTSHERLIAKSHINRKLAHEKRIASFFLSGRIRTRPRGEISEFSSSQVCSADDYVSGRTCPRTFNSFHTRVPTSPLGFKKKTTKKKKPKPTMSIWDKCKLLRQTLVLHAELKSACSCGVLASPASELRNKTKEETFKHRACFDRWTWRTKYPSGVPQGSVLGPLFLHFTCVSFGHMIRQHNKQKNI